MTIEQRLPAATVAAGTGFEVLASLAAASRAARGELTLGIRGALDAVGDTAGESWLNLLGVALDAGPPFTAERLLETTRALDPVELRRVLLGRYAWSWCTLAGIPDIEAAAEGADDAVARLLAQPRYYAGHAGESLTTLLSVGPEETQQRLAAAVEAAAKQIAPASAAELDAAAREASELLLTEPVLATIERLAGGYRYVPEVEADRIVLVPHLEPRLSLVLAQHRGARIVFYRARKEGVAEERLLALGRALSDPRRVEILVLVGRGVGRSSDLVEATGLTRSTVHHHLALLRDAGLVALEGNARAYIYVPARAAAAEAAALLGDVVGTEEQ